MMTPAELSLVLLLAQTCVAEISFQKGTAECELMWEINKARAEDKGWTITKQTKKFNSYWRSRKQSRMRPWIRHLTLDGVRPKKWPKHLRWNRHRERWLRYVESAQVFVKSKDNWSTKCKGAIDYGAPRELPKAHRRMKILKCLSGRTRQWYWGWK